MIFVIHKVPDQPMPQLPYSFTNYMKWWSITKQKIPEFKKSLDKCLRRLCPPPSSPLANNNEQIDHYISLLNNALITTASQYFDCAKRKPRIIAFSDISLSHLRQYKTAQRRYRTALRK